jgi:hypothetical protein
MPAYTLMAAGLLLMTLSMLSACSPPGCKTSTDPATCANTEQVNDYNRQRQLDHR